MHVICDICGRSASGSVHELASWGWWQTVLVNTCTTRTRCPDHSEDILKDLLKNKK